jgi:hypothetical protein
MHRDSFFAAAVIQHPINPRDLLALVANVHRPPIASHPPDMSGEVVNGFNIARSRGMARQPGPPVSKTPNVHVSPSSFPPAPRATTTSRNQTSFIYLLVSRILRPQLIRMRRSTSISLHSLFIGRNSTSRGPPLPLQRLKARFPADRAFISHVNLQDTVTTTVSSLSSLPATSGKTVPTSP